MKNNPVRDSIITYIKDNPGCTFFDIKCGATSEKLSSQLTSKIQSAVTALVKKDIVTRKHIDPNRQHLGFYHWYNEHSTTEPHAPTPLQRAISRKAQDKVDFILNLIETKPGITSSKLLSQFKVMGHGESISRAIEKLMDEKLIKRKQIQTGNPGAGFFYWPYDAVITQLVVQPTKRVSIPITTRPVPGAPIAQFPVESTQSNTRSNIEIAIRLCEIEAYRNPDKFDALMACAENIRKVACI